MPRFSKGDKVGLTGTVTRVDDKPDRTVITVEINGCWATARITLSAAKLTLLADRSDDAFVEADEPLSVKPG